MSGTRSPSPRAPVIEAVIVAHGQPSDPDPAESEIACVAGLVSALLPDHRIQGVTLAKPGALERVLASCTTRPTIYPFFMSDGWFTSRALPRRLNGLAGCILDPLGIDPALAGLAAEIILGAAASRHWPPDGVTLILAGHGSGRSRNSARATRVFADALSVLLPSMKIRIGFVEEEPSIAEAARDAGLRSICLPFFAASGGHVQDDIPQSLIEAGFVGETLEAIGISPQIPALVAQAILRTQPRMKQPGPKKRNHSPPERSATGFAV